MRLENENPIDESGAEISYQRKGWKSNILIIGLQRRYREVNLFCASLLVTFIAVTTNGLIDAVN
jgi:hypothetical protein